MKKPTEKIYKDYVRHNKDYVTLIHGSHRPLFISENKKDEYKSMGQLSALKWVTGILACILISIGVYVAFAAYIFPQFAKMTPEEKKAESVVSQVVENLPVIGDLVVTEYDKETGLPIYKDEFNLMLINSKNPMERDTIVVSGNLGGIKVDKRIVEALRMLISDAEDAGISIKLKSGVITYEEQEKLYNQKVQELITKEKFTKIMAKAEAKKFVAAPGEADAESGLSVVLDENADSFTKSSLYSWLNNNGATYGFVFRYPEGKEKYTGKNADYTVLRYVGKENALKMRQFSMCLEEFVSYKNKK